MSTHTSIISGQNASGKHEPQREPLAVDEISLPLGEGGPLAVDEGYPLVTKANQKESILYPHPSAPLTPSPLEKAMLRNRCFVLPPAGVGVDA